MPISSEETIPKYHPDKTVCIDEITSISESIFSFSYKKKLIDKFPLFLKKREKEYHEVQYHFDERDLIKINDLFPNIFPYSMCKCYEEYQGLSKNSYIELMKYTLCQHIVSGEFTITMKALQNLPDEFEIKWEEEAALYKKPMLKFVKAN